MNGPHDTSRHSDDAPLPTGYYLTPVREEVEEVSVVGVVNILLRHGRLLAWLPVVLACFAGTTMLLWGRGYTASASFAPQVSEELGKLSQVAGIASQFGVQMGGAAGDESVEFYARLLASKGLLDEVARSEYAVPVDGVETDTVRGTLVELFGIDDGSPVERARKAVDQLQDRLSIDVAVRANLVSFAVDADREALAVQIGNRILELVNDFNLRKRQSQARAERQFVEGRMEEAQRELIAAESALGSFLDQNRRYEESPQLSFEAARLQRRVDMSQQLYTSLAQAYEEARLEEVRNTPVMTVIEHPEDSVRRSHSVVGAGLLGFLLGGVIALGIALAKEYMARQRAANPEEYAEFEALRRGAIGQLLPGRLRTLLPALGNGRHAGEGAVEPIAAEAYSKGGPE